jgi:hypothetical protein
MDDADIRKFEYTFHAEMLKAGDLLTRSIAQRITEKTNLDVMVTNRTFGLNSIQNEITVKGNLPPQLLAHLSKVPAQEAAILISMAIQHAMDANKGEH